MAEEGVGKGSGLGILVEMVTPRGAKKEPPPRRTARTQSAAKAPDTYFLPREKEKMKSSH